MNKVKLWAAWAIVLAPFIILLIVINETSYQFGRSTAHQAIVVRAGYPYYRGNYYGTCAWSGEPWHSQQFCATEDDR